VPDVRTGSALGTVGALLEAGGSAADQVLAKWEICYALALKADLVVPADDERHSRVRADISVLV
jgi:hypothetical protein